MNTQKIPLTQLQVAPGNVRKTGGVPIYKLASSILAHGLLQNLVVAPVGDRFEVIAGGRRLQALQQLARDGSIEADRPIACNVLGSVSAHEASLAENVAREAMHPVDEFHAFQQLVDDEKLTPAEISERFGCTERHVAQRLRMANVAPAILAQYRDGQANLEQVQALALVEDHKEQLQAWGSKEGWHRRPDELRKALTAKDVAIESKLGRFVGLEAYKAAGGVLRADLFADPTTLPDAKLVRKLAQAKLDAEAKKYLDKGWGWAEGRLEFDYSEKAKYRNSGSAKPDVRAGVVVTMDWNGKVEVHLSLIKPGEKTLAKKGAAAGKTVRGKDIARETNDKLCGLRTANIRKRLRGNPPIALAALAAALAHSVLFDKPPYSRNRKQEPTTSVLMVEAGTYIDQAVEKAIAASDEPGAKEAAEWTKQLEAGAKKTGSLFAWLLSQKPDLVVRLLVFVTSYVATAESEGDVEEAHVHTFAKSAGVDLATGWTLSPAWIAAQQKPYVLQQVTAHAGKAAATGLEKVKASEFATAAFLALKGWIPEPLRAPAPKAAKAAAKKAAVKRAAPKKKAA